MTKKLLYSAPEAELLFVNFEENIMSPVPGEAGENNTYNEYEEVYGNHTEAFNKLTDLVEA